MKIAVIAHDGKKADMVAFVMKRLDFFKKVESGVGKLKKSIIFVSLKRKYYDTHADSKFSRNKFSRKYF